MTTRVIEGKLIVPHGGRVASVASRFNDLVVDRLIEGAVDTLVRHGAQADDITLVRVPGAFEIPPVVRRLAASGKVEAIIALGAVIRGSTSHYEYVAGEATKGIAAAATSGNVPIAFGVLTTESLEQAL